MWAAMSGKVTALAAQEIQRSLGPSEVFSQHGDADFLITFGDLDSGAANEKTNLIAARIKAGLGEQLPDIAGAISVGQLVAEIPTSTIKNQRPLASALFTSMARIQKQAERAAEQDKKAPLKDFEVLFAPVWHTGRLLTPFNRCFLDGAHSRSTSDLLGFEAPTVESAEVDSQLLTKSIQTVHRIMKAGRSSAMLLVPVDFRTVNASTAAARYVKLLESMPAAYRIYLMLEVCGLPQNHPPERIHKMTLFLQRYAKYVTVELSIIDPRLQALAELRAWAVSVDLSGMSSLNTRFAGQLKQFAAAATAAQISSMARGANSLGMALAASEAGFTYIEGTSIHLPGKEPRLPLWLRPLPASRSS
jgi:hypothetical protein